MHKTSPRHHDFAHISYNSCNPCTHARPQDIGYRARDPRNLNRVIAEIKELKKKVSLYDSLQLRTINSSVFDLRGFLCCFSEASWTALMRACRYMVFLSRLIWPFWFDSCVCVGFPFPRSQVAARAKESEEKQTLVDQAELSIGRNGAFAKLRDVTVKPVCNKCESKEFLSGKRLFDKGN
jgi:hypothetical protein